MSTSKARMYTRLQTLAAVALLACMPAAAQGLDSETAVQTIIGSDVLTDEVPIREVSDRLVTAIANVPESTAEVRRRFNLSEVGIVRVLEDETADTHAVVDAIETRRLEIDDLRVAIEGSAMFYHAINSRRIQLSDVIAMEFDGDDVLIYVLDNNSR